MSHRPAARRLEVDGTHSTLLQDPRAQRPGIFGDPCLAGHLPGGVRAFQAHHRGAHRPHGLDAVVSPPLTAERTHIRRRGIFRQPTLQPTGSTGSPIDSTTASSMCGRSWSKCASNSASFHVGTSGHGRTKAVALPFRGLACSPQQRFAHGSMPCGHNSPRAK